MEKAAILSTLIFFAVLPFTHALCFNHSRGMCSDVCESDHCTDPSRLRYGKYCGVGYSGCKGAAPCDGLDACCQQHDDCVGTESDDLEEDGTTNTTCSDWLLKCVQEWNHSTGAHDQFQGSSCSRQDVVNSIAVVTQQATGRYFYPYCHGHMYYCNTATVASAIPSPFCLLAVVSSIFLGFW
ncbi:hypothetical protein R1flu_022528 [Riccia fluitans]|uniref:Phospholipase A2 n=1 Tax=Riccia fluitans TaxID=41844 RepID=A0ABD1XPI2_9MARC